MSAQYFLPPDDKTGIRVPAAQRWARSSDRPDWCHDDSHAESDYIYYGPKWPVHGKKAEEIVAMVACHICWPRSQNRTVR